MTTLRPYQLRCIDSTFKEWEKVTSTMVVMATGLGKTVTFSEIIRRMYPKRSIVIAHRTELIHQAADHVRACGLEVEIEKADLRVSDNFFSQSPIIVASVQTLQSTERLEKFNPDHFGLLVCDETHHCVSKSYRKVFDYFRKNPTLKIFGCTATPDRSDEEALGQMFDSVAFKYDILDAITEGWLVPIEQQLIRIGSLDFSHVRTTAGDLNGADLAKIMEDEKNLQGICGAALEIIKDKRTIFFTASVKHAEQCTDILNRHKPGMAAFICGSTPDEERAVIMKDFKAGITQVLVNVGIATEGFNCPDVEVVVMARPTKSRSLYCQCIGRGTRALPGILDECHSVFERTTAIASSNKPSCLVLDFVGNSGRHKLITTADILGGKCSDEAKELAKKKAEKSGAAVNMKELIEESEEEIRKRMVEARAREAARKAALVAKVQYSSRIVNPFDARDSTSQYNSRWNRDRQFTEKQRALLVKIGKNPDEVSFKEGVELIGLKMAQWNGSAPASEKQEKVLRRSNWWEDGLTMKEATKRIGELAKNGWKRPHLVPEL